MTRPGICQAGAYGRAGDVERIDLDYDEDGT